MRDIEDMLWDLKYDMEQREEEYRETDARMQEGLNEYLNVSLKLKELTLSDIKTILATRDRQGRIERYKLDRNTRKILNDFVYNNEASFTLNSDDPEILGSPDEWFGHALENYLRKKNAL